VYGPDLAHVHDAGFGHIARAGAAALLRRLRRAGIRGGLIADLGCGSGIAARAFLDAGYDVLGVDASADMLAVARERAPGAELRLGSAADAALPPCVAVAAFGEVLQYGPDPRAGRETLAIVARRAAEALVPGGLLITDLAAPGREPPGGRRAWHEGDGWVVCVRAEEDPERGTLTREIATFRRDGASWLRSDERHVLRLVAPREARAAVAAAGLDARILPGYGALRLGPGHVVVLGRRPG
jgi:SAM-dependent methyltransferase